VTVRGVSEDPDGRRVELTEERWRHIVGQHPEIESLEEDVLRAVETPDRRLPGRLANEAWFYVRIEHPSRWLKVAVAYAEGRGYVVTAHPRRTMP
jgi:hypothetical protein